MMPVQGDPNRDWSVKWSPEEILRRLDEQKKKADQENQRLSDEGEEQDDDRAPPAKCPRYTLGEGEMIDYFSNL